MQSRRDWPFPPIGLKYRAYYERMLRLCAASKGGAGGRFLFGARTARALPPATRRLPRAARKQERRAACSHAPSLVAPRC